MKLELGDFYFGHPITQYGTSLENKMILEIGNFFPLFRIENPNQEIHRKGYEKYKNLNGKIGMDYYFEEVLPFMKNGGIFLPFEDGMFGAGVFSEALFLSKLNKSIYEIDYDFNIKFLKLNLLRKLTVEETRNRVYK